MKKFRISLYKEPYNSLSTEELDNLCAKVAETQYEITEENIKEFVGEGIAKNGYAFCPATFKDNEYGINSFEQTQLLVLSFPYSEYPNKPRKVSFDFIMDRIQKYKFQPIFAWDMFHRDFFGDGKYGSFLIGFLMDTPFYDYRSAEAAQRALLMMFPEAKSYPCNSIQIYQGGLIS